MTSGFIHLHVHSEYSLVDGLIRLPSLVERTVTLEMPAIALTDQSNLFSLVKFYQMARRGGVKPIIGAELWLRGQENTENRHRVLFLCRDQGGYRQLSALITRSYLEGQSRGVPAISYDWLVPELTPGLIVLSAGINGDIGAALIDGNAKRADELARYWKGLFGDAFYLELTRTGREGELQSNDGALELAEKNSIPVVQQMMCDFSMRKNSKRTKLVYVSRMDVLCQIRGGRETLRISSTYVLGRRCQNFLPMCRKPLRIAT